MVDGAIEVVKLGWPDVTSVGLVDGLKEDSFNVLGELTIDHGSEEKFRLIELLNDGTRLANRQRVSFRQNILTYPRNASE